jgi:organic hydroperoxide reductase OsmC/OhrA
MHQYDATILWQRDGQQFVDNRYSRAHEWQFDGGARVAASSSPSSVPLPMSVAANVDPEEALVAATASCHMLFFLSFAARAGFVVERYADPAFGVMDKNAEGRMAITRIVLRPQIQFAGTPPSADAQARLHDDAHRHCYIANSLKAEVTVQAR